MKRHNQRKGRQSYRARTRRPFIQLPPLEQLERRILLSTYTVNTVADALNPGPGLVSLRLAVARANTFAGADTINFDPNVFTPNLLHTITLLNGPMNFSDLTGATTVMGPGSNIVAINGTFNTAGGQRSSTRDLVIAVGATLSISGVRIIGGSDPNGGPGGGIFNGGTLTLQNVIVKNNFAQGFQTTGTQMPSPGSGGGIFSAGSLTVISSTVANNSADGVDAAGSGGGIYSTGTTTIQNSSITSNSAGNDSQSPAFGGGIYAAGSLIINSSVVSSNEADGGDGGGTYYPAGDATGGGIYCSGALSISSSTLQNNSAKAGGEIGDEGTTGGNARGGGIYATGSSSKITSSQITGNAARGGAGGLYGFDGAGYGGGVYAATAITINSGAISGNTASGGQFQTRNIGAAGGGIYNKASLTLNQSTVSGNTAQGTGGTYDAVDGAEGDGGGIFAAGPLTASRSTIDSNTAAGGAGNKAEPTNFPATPAGNGGLAQGGGAFGSGAILFTDCTIANNHAAGGAGGGGASMNGISENAGSGGNAAAGGLFARGSLQLRDTTLSGNTSTGGAAGGGYGVVSSGKNGTASAGGILATAVQPLFSNSIISANKAGGSFSDIVGAAQSSSGFNLIGVGGRLTNGINGNKVGINNPKLQPLGDYGGPTQTMLPMAGSPAINAGSNALIPSGVTTDQRGLPRIFANRVDIGADEAVSLTLSGSVFNDKNGDGIRQSTDPGLANWQVYIDLNNIGVFVAGDPIATTNSLGNYTLTYVPTSNKSLIIREVRQNNWRRTQPAGIYPLGFYTVSPTSGSATHLVFGNSITALITGTVYNDANSNDKNDSGEKGLANFRVYVDLNHDGKFESTERSTLTDSSGNWSIAGLAPGSYTIRVVQPSGWKPTAPAGAAMSLSLTSGETLTGLTFGEKTV